MRNTLLATLLFATGAMAQTIGPPQVNFAVYDGSGIIAGCTDPTCFGKTDGTNPNPGTGTVTHDQNNVGWSVSGNIKGSVVLYVDGVKAQGKGASARPGSLLVWNVKDAGPHKLVVKAEGTDGKVGVSKELTITRK